MVFWLSTRTGCAMADHSDFGAFATTATTIRARGHILGEEMEPPGAVDSTVSGRKPNALN